MYAWWSDRRSLPWGARVQATGFQQLWRTATGYTERFVCSLSGLFVQAGHHSLLDTCTKQCMVTVSSLHLAGQPKAGSGPAGAGAYTGEAQPQAQGCRQEDAASRTAGSGLLSTSKHFAWWSLRSMVWMSTKGECFLAQRTLPCRENCISFSSFY